MENFTGAVKLLAIVVLIITAAGVFIIFNKNKQGFIVAKDTYSLSSKNLLAKAERLPVLGAAPELRGIKGWLNTKPLSLKDLRGKVALLDFWTYSCINCIRTIPHLEAWYEKYKGNEFVILGVHSPEFDFEKKIENVAGAIKKYGITYPVALDSEHETWNAFGNQYWPAHYLIDADGNIRYRSFGEGHYAETESAIQNLLLEANLLTLDKITEIKEPPADADFKSIETPEIYLGYARINNAGNIDPDTKPDSPHVFTEPTNLSPNRFYLVGTWIIRREASELTGKNGKIIIRYKSGKVNIVAETERTKEIHLKIFLDGKLKGETLVSSPRLYNLIDEAGDYNWHTLEIRIPDSGLRVFTFTFG